MTKLIWHLWVPNKTVRFDRILPIPNYMYFVVHKGGSFLLDELNSPAVNIFSFLGFIYLSVCPASE